jgi:hypothetical protein
MEGGMKSIYDNDTVQIEITNACQQRCANCTRFVGHRTPFFMSLEQFKRAVDSMEGYPKMTGMMGGEPLLHPKFAEFCEYMLSRIPRRQLGLWTSFPVGYEHYREVICNTFGNIFVNDHSRWDIHHHPFLVGIEEVIRNKDQMFVEINRCPFQEWWSASINPHGAFFCEIAASMSMLFDDGEGWKVKPGWWWRTPKDYKDQIEKWCPRCGGALRLKRRLSVDNEIDDISFKNVRRLQGFSHKVEDEKYNLHDLQQVDEMEPLASYKDMQYRNAIAYRYGMYLTINENDFNEPHLMNDLHRKKSLINKFKEQYG